MKKKATQFSPEAFQGLGTLIHEVVREELVPIEKKIDSLHNNVDSYLKQTTGWHDEQIILGARVDKINDVMIKKGLASGEELGV